ncbi:hypothetical protein HKX48_000636 [Thoreauomyces humboldtii]|nr:hypothetical protein HKX48_000636 [Thoreauomyces humboldtii]
MTGDKLSRAVVLLLGAAGIVVEVTGTVTPILILEGATPVPATPVLGFSDIKNVDFPLLRESYTSVAGVPNAAVFHDPYTMGVCRIANYSDSAGGALEYTFGNNQFPFGYLLNPNVGLVSILAAYEAGCPRYQYLGYANGWFEECPAGTDIAAMLAKPGNLPCSTNATRPTLALWVMLDPPANWCCPDEFFGTPTPINGYNYEEFRSITPQTGISIPDSLAWFDGSGTTYPVVFFNVTSEGADEKFTLIMRSKAYDFYMVFRQIVSLTYLLVETFIMGMTLKTEGFRLNLKWGVLTGIYLMTLLVCCLHALFLSFRSHSYQLPTHGTPTQISLMCFGFMFGYEALSLMLLKWLAISSSRQESSKTEKTAVQIYRGFIFLTMGWFPLITIGCVVAIVYAANLNSLDVLNTFYKLWNTMCGSLAITLYAHALGFLYSGYRLTSTLNQGKRMTGTRSNAGAGMQSDTGKGSTKPKKSGLTTTVRNLMIAVVLGWSFMGIELTMNWALGLGSRYGFFSGLFYDLCVAWIAAASYCAMSAGMMETAIDTMAGRTSSNGGSAQASQTGTASATGRARAPSNVKATAPAMAVREIDDDIA